ncbi:hypothetical protein ASAP_0621 [Asaia bogorensis]|uniref:Uncharacterized protein n=1 Tax=Asaia bogorensis TaxID=91915 RepID=A0A060QHF7_9PROT|nr:hypothetical protein ASAP_0621 [Asaia bogorensis]
MLNRQTIRPPIISDIISLTSETSRFFVGYAARLSAQAMNLSPDKP